MADDNVDDGGNDYNEGNLSYVCAAWAPILGFAGIASAVVFASTFPLGRYRPKSSMVRMAGVACDGRI